MQKTTSLPVHRDSMESVILRETAQTIDFNEFNDDSDQCDPQSLESRTPDELRNIAQWARTQEDMDSDRKNLIKFSDEIKIDFIPSIDYRILCRFLGVTSVNDVKNHPYQSNPLLTLLLMESLEKFMESNDYEFVGELNFDQNGNSIPPDKNPWHVKGKETTFTITGFLYFEHKSKKRKDNVVFFLYTNLERGGASITCYSTDTNKSKELIHHLQIYAKKNNCLRGTKLKDVNMISASFSEVDINEKYTWDNYYYPENIKNLFELEILGFINNVEKYNESGIMKRGVILHGRPGTGKSTLGNIICNLVPEHTVIWITPEILSENNYKTMSSIKTLYKLADFLSPCIIILEDLDLFGQDRERGGDIVSLGALMNVLDGVNSIVNSITVGITNRLSFIETALRNRPGRFDRIIEIPSLTKELRKKMLRERLSQWKMSDEVLSYLLDKTFEWTGAEIQELVNSLNLKYISSKGGLMRVDDSWAEEVIKTMNEFGVGEVSSQFGFNKKS
jgi:SpoVK/Ycf46/Vps4 family AAA+-type ATPase